MFKESDDSSSAALSGHDVSHNQASVLLHFFVPKCKFPCGEKKVKLKLLERERERGSSSNTRVKLLHRDGLIAHYWLSVLQHIFPLWPLEAPSSLCVSSSLSRWSWRSYSHSMKWSLNFSTGATWTKKEKTRTPRNQRRKGEERRRGIRSPHQVRSITCAR